MRTGAVTVAVAESLAMAVLSGEVTAGPISAAFLRFLACEVVGGRATHISKTPPQYSTAGIPGASVPRVPSCGVKEGREWTD